jgi:hypothetical protein
VIDDASNSGSAGRDHSHWYLKGDLMVKAGRNHGRDEAKRVDLNDVSNEVFRRTSRQRLHRESIQRVREIWRNVQIQSDSMHGPFLEAEETAGCLRTCLPRQTKHETGRSAYGCRADDHSGL